MSKPFFLILAGIVVVIIITLFIVFQFMSPTSLTPQHPKVVIPTPVERTPLPITPGPKPRVPYNNVKTNDLVNKAKNRQPLSAGGTAAKERLKSQLSGASGSIYTSDIVNIEYVAAPDLFQAEILSPNISLVKDETVNWMLSQEFTKEDVCNLPLSFYMSPAVSSQLQDSTVIFNPLPEGC